MMRLVLNELSLIFIKYSPPLLESRCPRRGTMDRGQPFACWLLAQLSRSPARVSCCWHPRQDPLWLRAEAWCSRVGGQVSAFLLVPAACWGGWEITHWFFSQPVICMVAQGAGGFPKAVSRLYGDVRLLPEPAGSSARGTAVLRPSSCCVTLP